METKRQEQRSKKNEQAGSLSRFAAGGAIRALEGEGNERRFRLSFSSEEPYERWWGTEILSHNEGAVDLTRLNSIGVVLFNHDRDKVIGKVTRAWIENGRGEAEIEFDTDEAAQTVYEKVEGGTLRGVSVGYTVEAWEEVADKKTSSDGKFKGPCDVARAWTPYEISIVSVPADPTVGVGRQKETEGKRGACGLSVNERQLQINKNLLKREGGRADESKGIDSKAAGASRHGKDR